MNDFVAVCQLCSHNFPGQPPCKRDRRSTQGTRLAQGRPLGFLVAWLGSGIDCRDRRKHMSKEALAISHADRLAARVALEARAVAEPDVHALLALEREQRGGEGPEPLEVP